MTNESTKEGGSPEFQTSPLIPVSLWAETPLSSPSVAGHTSTEPHPLANTIINDKNTNHATDCVATFSESFPGTHRVPISTSVTSQISPGETSAPIVLPSLKKRRGGQCSYTGSKYFYMCRDVFGCRMHVAKHDTKKCLFEQVAESLSKSEVWNQPIGWKSLLGRYTLLQEQFNGVDRKIVLHSGHAGAVSERDELLSMIHDASAEQARLTEMKDPTFLLVRTRSLLLDGKLLKRLPFGLLRRILMTMSTSA